MTAAPIAIFIYKRTQPLAAMLESLKACHGFAGRVVYVFADGPKNSAAVAAVAEARAIAQTMLPHAELRFSDTNLGLSKAIIGGVGAVLAAHERAIVLEDDFVLHPDFLTYMDGALAHYADADQVHQVSGHMFDHPALLGHGRPMLLPLTTTWGWGVWRRSWATMDWSLNDVDRLDADPGLRHRFNQRGAYDYSTMLRRQQRGQINSWGIQWYWHVFKRGGFSVFPPFSLIQNGGADGSGEHGGAKVRRFMQPLVRDTPIRYEWPMAAADETLQRAMRAALWRQNGGLIGRLLDVAKKIAKR
jgi:hypothetical protein